MKNLYLGTAIGITAISIGFNSAFISDANAQSASVPEISWRSDLRDFGLDTDANVGKQFSFKCPATPANLPGYKVWGSDNYTASSGICLSGLHAGMITRDGGIVNVQINPGQSFYTGSQRNGIESNDYRATDRSLTFIGTPIATNNQQATVNQQQPESIPEISWRSNLRDFGLDTSGNLGRQFSFECPPAPANLSSYYVWGSDNYTASSKICLSGLHAGMITRDGGTVTLQINPGKSLYTGSQRNGIESNDYRATDRSFAFIGNPIITNNNNSPFSSSNSSDNSPFSSDNESTSSGGTSNRRSIGDEVRDRVEDGAVDALRGLF